MCSKLTIKRPNDVKDVFIFNFIVNFMYSSVFIVNFQHILHLPRREKCWNTCFILEKRKKSKFNRLQIEVFFLPNISPPISPPPPPSPNPYIGPPNIDPSNLSFASIYAQDVLTGFYRSIEKIEYNLNNFLLHVEILLK